MNELALFAGAGGGLLASKLLGWRTVCAVESDAFCCRVLSERQNDGSLEPFPIWNGDIGDFDARGWEVDVVSGGFPCTDISSASANRNAEGIKGPQSGLWSAFARIIREVDHPGLQVFVENSPMLVTRGLHRVLSDLASMGFLSLIHI